MTNPFDAREFQERLERLDALLREMEHADPVMRTRFQEVVQTLLTLHGWGLERLLEHVIETGETGQAIIDTCARDDVVSGLLLLHDLHPLDVEERVHQALESVRPFLRAHAGNVELLGVSDGIVRLRLQGSCDGCPSSVVTVRQTIEEAIYGKAPEVMAVEVEGLPETSPQAENGRLRVALPLV